MQNLMKGLGFTGKILNAVSIVALLVMVCITVADIFLKNLFKAPITGSIEITRMMMICMTPTFTYALIERRHVSVGMFIDKLGRTGQLVFDTFGYLISAGICGIMCYQGIIDMGKKMAQHQVYTMLKIPTWPFYLIFSVSMGFFAIAILIFLANQFYDKNSHVKLYNEDENKVGGAE